MVKGSRHKARRAAVQALYQWHLTQQRPGDIEDHFILDHEMNDVDVDYFHHLVREIPLHIHALDDHITPHLDRDINELSPIEFSVLLLAAFELSHHQEVPYRVVINEAVELAKTFGGTDGHKFVNGVLDKLASKVRATEVNAK